MRLKWVGGILAGGMLAVAVVVLGIVVVARLHDGPLGGALAIVAGGPFESGELRSEPEADWSFLRDYDTVEFQLLEPARSRTTWIMEHDNRIFIVSGYMNTWYGKLWKHWPAEAEADGRVVLRVDGKRYELQMVRITAGDIVEPVLAELSRKYVGGAPIPPSEVASGNMWMFELTRRP